MDSTTLPMDDGVVVRLLLVKVFVCEALRDGPELSGNGCSIILGIFGGSVSECVGCTNAKQLGFQFFGTVAMWVLCL